MRLVNELGEMTNRIEGLTKFMASPACKALSPMGVALLSQQAAGMMLYSKALSLRLALTVKE